VGNPFRSTREPMRTAKALKPIALAVIFLSSIVLLSPVQGSWLSDATGINIDINKQVGTGIEAMSAPTVDAFQQAGTRLIDQADQKFAARLAQAGTIVAQAGTIATAAIQSINQTLTGTISSIDADISNQLAAADELLEKRLGNIDTIAAKATLTVESVVARLIFLGCIMIFAACAVWRIYVLGYPSWSAERDHSSKGWLKKNWWQLTWQLGGAAVALLVLCGLFWLSGPHGEISKLVAQHDHAYRAAMRALDFRQARYHSAQLKILDAGDQSYLGYEMKANLLQDVLMRPALYQTLAGLRELSFRMSQAQSYLGDDPDVRVVGALVAWNSGGSRAHQYVAAVLCADALSHHPRAEEINGAFVLRPLAIEYLKDYLLNPIPNELIKFLLPVATANDAAVRIAFGPPPIRVRAQYPTIEQLYETLKTAESPGKGATLNDIRVGEVGGPISHIIKFDQIARTLYKREIPTYINMVAASQKVDNANYPADQKGQLSTARQNSARDIASAWRSFDLALATDTDLADSVATIRSMMLNEAFLARADTYTNYSPDEVKNNVAYSSTAHQAFLDSYINTHIVGDSLATVKAYVTAQRGAFSLANAKDESDFRAAMVDFDTMSDGGVPAADFGKAKTAAVFAAKLGLFTCGSANCENNAARTTPVAITIKETYNRIHPDAPENAKFATDLDPDLRLAYNAPATVLW